MKIWTNFFVFASLLLFFSCSKKADDYSVQNEKTEFHSEIPSNVSIIDTDGKEISASSVSEIENAANVWSFTFPIDKDTSEGEAKWGDDTNKCCRVYNAGYGQPLPPFPPSIFCNTEGYTDSGASSYFIRLQIQKRINFKWVTWYDHFWLDFERVCDGHVYGRGWVIDLGDCPEEYRAIMRKGHYDAFQNPIYCVGGDMVVFDYEGDPEICDEQ